MSSWSWHGTRRYEGHGHAAHEEVVDAKKRAYDAPTKFAQRLDEPFTVIVTNSHPQWNQPLDCPEQPPYSRYRRAPVKHQLHR